MLIGCATGNKFNEKLFKNHYNHQNIMKICKSRRADLQKLLIYSF